MRRRVIGNREKKLFIKRFFPAGTYTWVVPAGCTEVDVFLVGGGGSGRSNGNGAGGGGGYTKTFKSDRSGWRDGDAIQVSPGQIINITVGAGSTAGSQKQGGSSQFMNANYVAPGGYSVQNGTAQVGDFTHYHGANGGSGGAGDIYNNTEGKSKAGSDGGNGVSVTIASGLVIRGGTGQGHTTRDFGEPNGNRNAGGGDSRRCIHGGGVSDYVEGSGGNATVKDDTQNVYGVGGGGYGGGAAPGSKGGDGTVLIRYYAYEE